jgi:hypothetical protein
VLFGLYERRNGQEYDVDFVKGLIFLGRACSWLCGAGAAPKPLATVSGGSVVPCPFAADLLCKPFAIDRSGYLSGSTANLVARHIHVPHAASLPLTGEHSWQTRCTAEAVLSDSRDLTCTAQLLSRCTGRGLLRPAPSCTLCTVASKKSEFTLCPPVRSAQSGRNIPLQCQCVQGHNVYWHMRSRTPYACGHYSRSTQHMAVP